jgi:hypothetical protein
MSSFMAERPAPLATFVAVDDEVLMVHLTDGRSIAAPLAWYLRLTHATAEERNGWRLTGGGQGIHWPAIDEDESVASILAGQPSAESHSSLKKWLVGRDKPPRGRKRSEE